MPASKDIKRALARVRAALPVERKVAVARRDIRLGLERISRIVPDQQSWLGVHVGGTNGKGSICALLAGMLKRAGISHGLFVSPAIPEPHNGVIVNGRFVNKRMHRLELVDVDAAYRRAASGWTFAMGEDPGDPTPFELETAAAFRIFETMRVKYGIVEVGMGGATDATNAMRQKSVTVISKIDLDHQSYLGNTIEEIAKVKAGIMRPDVPCVVDDSNPPNVMQVLREQAHIIGTNISLSSKAEPLLADLDLERFSLEPYERENLLCAVLAFQLLFPKLELDIGKLLASKPYLSGRKEKVRVSALTGGTRKQPLLVDGAHNMLGVEALHKHVQGKVRQGREPVTWVMGLSASTTKPFAKMIETLVQPQDNFAFIEYAPMANTPPAVPAEIGRDVAKEVLFDETQLYDGDPSISPALRWACEKAGEGPIVVTGSLYLIGELHKLEGVEAQWKIGTRRPGPSQLWHYTRLSQERALTPEEAREFKRARRHWYLSPKRNATFRSAADGTKPLPWVVPDKVRQHQRTAALHKTQADECAAAISSIEKVLQAGSLDGGQVAAGPAELGQSVQELKRRRDEHLKAYNQAMFRTRGHEVDPDMKTLSYEQIFGKPDKANKGQVVSLLHKHGLDEADIGIASTAASTPESAAPEAPQPSQNTTTNDARQSQPQPRAAPSDRWAENEMLKGRRGS
ncbi:mur ligase middle domain-containing protein [Hirsutella rhossiliensis]|uniref:Mur ligase middle domain-containing protein n=1 Tax=Hirsutella rhossiliensis TaxID=111463 RepID=A0A9P8MKQ2_9HYPO|nr:mur ligase middle domain-containing protein [Hirsutella rhossiliensis]KAH0958093.1 mur ligase middle domain-containing protein [Hirsutella rhossiliensis]